MKKLSIFYLLIVLFISCNLEQGEIGPKGTSSLINVIPEPSGSNCSSGGFKIEVGTDINSDGILDADEVQTTQYICNGGNGMNSLINATEETAGDNCSNGGFKIEVGIDINKNGILDTDEVQSMQYICNGDNGTNSLINVAEEAAGNNCSNGGFKIEIGTDLNNNGILDADEVQSMQYICNGDNGMNSLINATEEAAGNNCSNGGLKIEVGIDINKNGILDTDEVQSTQYICNGDNGTNSLINVAEEAAGDNCSNGGFKIETGNDLNNNGILDADEVQSTQYICNGENGTNSLINVIEEAAGNNCSYGGYKIEVGTDLNGNGVLDIDEIQSTDYICFGENNTIDNNIFKDNWTVMETSVTNPLSGIWGTSNSFYAVGGSTAVSESEHLGIILKFENNSWNIEKNDWTVRMIISDIDGISDNEIYAVGKIWDGGTLTGVFLKFDGENWSETQLSWQPTKVKVIDGNVYVTATNSLYKLINGTLVKIFNYNFHGIDLWGTSTNDLYLVGFSGGTDYIYHYNGINWTNMLANSDISSSFLSCIEGSNNEIYAAGTAGKILKYAGDNWDVIEEGFDPIYDLHIVDLENIYFVTGKYLSTGKIYKYDGNNFNLEYTSQAAYLSGIWEYEGVGLIAVGSGGEIVSKKIN